eukprot:scaffold20705_cov127-Isochrysis_galbana.AAC.3
MKCVSWSPTEGGLSLIEQVRSDKQNSAGAWRVTMAPRQLASSGWSPSRCGHDRGQRGQTSPR